MGKIVSLLTPSIHKEKLQGFFDNVQNAAADLRSFEVLVKIDGDHKEMIDYLDGEVKTRPFSLKYIATPKLDGYWSIHTAALRRSTSASLQKNGWNWWKGLIAVVPIREMNSSIFICGRTVTEIEAYRLRASII